MEVKRIVIIGGPGSGKTTLINHLQEKGHPCMHEISREITSEAQKEGIEQLFLEQPLLFSEKLLAGRLKQFHAAEALSNYEYLFYDRGMPDVTAYMDYVGTEYPKRFESICENNKYDAIFMLPPWEEIYQTDNERYESFEQAQIIYEYLYKGYQKHGYQIILVPMDSVENRIQFILEKLKELA